MTRVYHEARFAAASRDAPAPGFYRHIVRGSEALGTLTSPLTLGLSVSRVFDLATSDD